MNIEELISKIPDYGALYADFRANKADKIDAINKIIKQLNPVDHDINDSTKRPDKTYINERNETVVSKVSRLVVPFQKKIVAMSAAFLCGNPIELKSTPQDDKQKTLLSAVTKVWDDNKLDYKSKSIAKLMMSETEVAELWYTEPLEQGDTYWDGVLDRAKFKLRMRILAHSKGDKLYPIYSLTGDMIAFGREYLITLSGNKVETHFDIYTADSIYKGTQVDGKWEVVTETNIFKKIPIIYYSQEEPEWADVQKLIDRYEEQLSNHADTNDYFGSPLVVVQGTIKGFAKKGESGKVLETEKDASVNYLTWDQSPASVKLEMDTLKELIFNCTDTPDISFEKMKSLGNYSGIALKMLFLSAHMKASDKEEIFGEGIQRRINYLKTAIGVLDVSFEKVVLSIKPKFEYFLPKNDTEKIDMLSTAVSGKLMSAQSAVKENPLVSDSTIELELIKEESTGADALSSLMQ